jgi:hypothetical protein
MALPPGRDAVPVPGIEASTNPRLAKASSELAAWVDYLLHPETHDGPRIYRPLHPETGPDHTDFETPYRMPPADRDAPYEDPDEYETVSVFEDFADDPTGFFKAAQAVSGISTDAIEPTYDKLTKGCLTWKDADDAKNPGAGQIDSTAYEEKNATRANWEAMRNGWVALEAASAYAYEEDFLRYQVFTENAVYIVAEHLARYRAVLHKAGEDVLELVQAMVEMCPKPNPPGEGGFNLLSILVTAIAAGAATVITAGSGGVTAPVLLGVVVTEVIGEAVKTAEQKGAKNELALDNHKYLRDTARQYIDEIGKIERETADAINGLRDSLRHQLDSLRDKRTHEVKPESGTMSDAVPVISEY